MKKFGNCKAVEEENYEKEKRGGVLCSGRIVDKREEAKAYCDFDSLPPPPPPPAADTCTGFHFDHPPAAREPVVQW